MLRVVQREKQIYNNELLLSLNQYFIFFMTNLIN